MFIQVITFRDILILDLLYFPAKNFIVPAKQDYLKTKLILSFYIFSFKYEFYLFFYDYQKIIKSYESF